MGVVYELDAESAGELPALDDQGWAALLLKAGEMAADQGDSPAPTYFWDGGEDLVKVRPGQVKN